MASDDFEINGIFISYNADTATIGMSAATIPGITTRDEETFIEMPYPNPAALLDNGRAARRTMLRG